MKKLLILTSSTGAGHNQAASALEGKFKAKEYEVVKYDFISENSHFLKEVVVDGYEFFASKLPLIYGKLYKLTDKMTTSKGLSYGLNFFIENKVLEFINKEQPDLIIGTHPFSVAIVSSLKTKGLIDIPFISIITDFKPHYAYVNDKVDAYITATEYTKRELCRRNIPDCKVFSYGIPIKEDFFNTDINDNLYETSNFNVLLMGGSMGLKGIYKVLEELVTNKNSLNITVVCGKNEELREKLCKKYSGVIENKKINILGFTKEIPKLMEESDIIITKPGGLTVSEAIAKKLPMLIPFAIPGQEEENAEFLESVGAGIYIKEIKDINHYVNSLIENPDKIIKMKKKISDLSKNVSADNIVYLSENLIKKCDGNKTFSLKTQRACI